MTHPKLEQRIRYIVESTIAGTSPRPEDPDELAELAASIDIDVETLIDWRNDYQWWTTEDEWRSGTTDAVVKEIARAMSEPGPRHWSRWRAWRRIVHHLSMLGVVSGSMWVSDWSGTRVEVLSWTGRRSKYTGRRSTPSSVLYWPTRKWGCVLRRRHWPNDDHVSFGLCSKCLPCPDCGAAVPLEHECGVAT